MKCTFEEQRNGSSSEFVLIFIADRGLLCVLTLCLPPSLPEDQDKGFSEDEYTPE